MLNEKNKKDIELLVDNHHNDYQRFDSEFDSLIEREVPYQDINAEGSSLYSPEYIQQKYQEDIEEMREAIADKFFLHLTDYVQEKYPDSVLAKKVSSQTEASDTSDNAAVSQSDVSNNQSSKQVAIESRVAKQDDSDDSHMDSQLDFDPTEHARIAASYDSSSTANQLLDKASAQDPTYSSAIHPALIMTGVILGGVAVATAVVLSGGTLLVGAAIGAGVAGVLSGAACLLKSRGSEQDSYATDSKTDTRSALSSNSSSFFSGVASALSSTEEFVVGLASDKAVTNFWENEYPHVSDIADMNSQDIDPHDPAAPAIMGR